MNPDARQRRLREELAAWQEPLDAVRAASPDPDAFCADKWELACRSGILRLPFEPRFGGRGEDLLTTMYALESVGHAWGDGGLAFSVSSHIVSTGVPIQRFGSDALKERWLPRLCDGAAIGAHAITEPSGGSDALSMQTHARDCGGHYVLDGVKTFITNAPVAGAIVVYASTKPEAGALGVTAFLVDARSPGLHVGAPIRKMGLAGSPMAELRLDGCEVGADSVIGRPGAGFFVLDHVMKWEILCSFSASVGAMQRRLERCVEHARTRRQFGRPIGAFQAVSHKIVDMRIAIETARRWLYDTAARFLAGEDTTADIAIAKLVASEANVSSALAAVQIFGATGYTTGCGLEADLRDAVAGTIYSGTSEIQRNRIAATLGLRDRPAQPSAMEPA